MNHNALLLLEDGRRFSGLRAGAAGTSFGEVVFNTSMTGYQEVLTDPSYAGQIVVMTAPMMGNYGVNAADVESGEVRVSGFVVREMPATHSSWRAEGSLRGYLEDADIVAISDVDTRALTRHIRSEGAMRAAVTTEADVDEEELLTRIRAHPCMEGLDLACVVSTPERFTVPARGERRFRVAAFDMGVKTRSLDLLSERGCEVEVFPAGAGSEDVLAAGPDGLFVSNGPGDPASVASALETIRTLGEQRIPVFGICLGQQLVARAYGGRTYKLLYGHRGGNHPVRRLEDGAVEITAQNHGFAVEGSEEGVPGAPDLEVTHLNLNDGTVEGVAHRTQPVFAVQYHPEGAPGPHDSHYLFDRFLAAMEGRRGDA